MTEHLKIGITLQRTSYPHFSLHKPDDLFPDFHFQFYEGITADLFVNALSSDR